MLLKATVQFLFGLPSESYQELALERLLNGDPAPEMEEEKKGQNLEKHENILANAFDQFSNNINLDDSSETFEAISTVQSLGLPGGGRRVKRGRNLNLTGISHSTLQTSLLGFQGEFSGGGVTHRAPCGQKPSRSGSRRHSLTGGENMY